MISCLIWNWLIICWLLLVFLLEKWFKMRRFWLFQRLWFNSVDWNWIHCQCLDHLECNFNDFHCYFYKIEWIHSRSDDLCRSISIVMFVLNDAVDRGRTNSNQSKEQQRTRWNSANEFSWLWASELHPADNERNEFAYN